MMSLLKTVTHTPCMQRLFYILLCCLFAVTGFNIGFYPVFYATGFVALMTVYLVWKESPPTQRWMLFLPLLFILYVAISPGHLFKDLPIADKMLTSFLIGLAASLLPRHLLFRAILFLPLALAVLFAYGFITGFQHSMELGSRLKFYFSHPNILGFIGVWCTLFLLFFPKKTHNANEPPLAQWQILRLSQWRILHLAQWRILRLALTFILLVIVMLSMSRASLLGGIGAALLIAVLKYSLFSQSHLVTTPSRYHLVQRCALGLTLCFGLGIFGYTLLPHAQWQRLQSAVLAPTQDATFQSRLVLWNVAWQGIAANPITGNAIRTFPAHYNAYIQKNGKTLRQSLAFVDDEANHPHNLYIGFAFAYGGIGLALFTLTLIPAVTSAWKQQNLFFLAILLLYLLHGFLDYPLHRKDGILLLFFPIGMMYGSLVFDRVRDAASGELPAEHKQ